MHQNLLLTIRLRFTASNSTINGWVGGGRKCPTITKYTNFVSLFTAKVRAKLNT